MYTGKSYKVDNVNLILILKKEVIHDEVICISEGGNREAKALTGTVISPLVFFYLLCNLPPMKNPGILPQKEIIGRTAI